MRPLEASAAPSLVRVACLVGLTLTGCDRETAPQTCGRTARPLAVAVGFDANSDGVLDVADGAWLLRRNFRGGEDPPCLQAVEAFGDKVSDSATAWASWYALLSGTAVPELEAGVCEAPADVEAACGDGLALDVEAPAEVSGASGSTVEFSASVRLSSPSLPVEAWSLSLSTLGCTVSAATLDGTLGADRRDDPPGARDGGVGAAETSTTGGALSLVVLDPIGGATVSPGSATEVLTLTVTAEVGGSCSDCVLSLEDGAVGRGRAMSNTASSEGRSYAPALTGATVRICPRS